MAQGRQLKRNPRNGHKRPRTPRNEHDRVVHYLDERDNPGGHIRRRPGRAS